MPTRNWIIAVLALVLLSGCALFNKGEEEELPAEELYAIARESLDKGNWVTAVDQLRELEARYPYGTHAEQAQLDTIYAYYRAKDPGLAIAAADRFIKLHPTHPSVDYAYYAKGLANYHEDNSLFGRLTGKDDLSDRDPAVARDAMDAFTDVYELFPSSRYAADARARARYLHNSLARHELAVASYYLSRNACVAVVNRAKGIIENYDTTPAVEEALALLVLCYRKMELNDLSEDAFRVLKLNFPESEYLGESGRGALVRNLQVPGATGEKEEKAGFLPSLLTRFRASPES